MTTFTATYSPEDNKLRIYASERLDDETYTKVKELGFRWAPKQELFVAPKWTPEREDFCILLAGDIEPEGTTLAERAQMKADRLDELAVKRDKDANAFSRAANDLSERFSAGQPILIGHHSERKARKDKERMETAQSKSVKANELANYWRWRAMGVEAHANHKNDPKTRKNRIKTLLGDLRDIQRAINASAKAHKTWSNTSPDDHDAILALCNHPTESLVPYGAWSDLRDGKIECSTVHANAMKRTEIGMTSTRRARFIAHILNRLDYEQSFMPAVELFEGELTPAILQTFARTHGADKPKARAVDDSWELSSPVTLPLHIANGCIVEMTADDWCDLMQSVGYEVPAKKMTKPPILNFKADKLLSKSRFYGRGNEELRQVEMTKEQYSKVHPDSRWVQTSACGQFRFKVAPDPEHKGPYYSAGRVAVFLTDSKVHPAPDGFHNEQSAEA